MVLLGFQALAKLHQFFECIFLLKLWFREMNFGVLNKDRKRNLKFYPEFAVQHELQFVKTFKLQFLPLFGS